MKDGLNAPLRPSSFWRQTRTPFDKGMRAANCNAEKADNPYPDATNAHSDWDAGFDMLAERIMPQAQRLSPDASQLDAGRDFNSLMKR